MHARIAGPGSKKPARPPLAARFARLALAGTACLCACTRVALAPLPALDGVASWLIIFPQTQRGLAASTDVPAFDAGDDDLVLAFGLAHPLSSLLLEPGPFHLELSSASDRAWPASLRDLRLEAGDWRDAEAAVLFERDQRLRLPRFPAERCRAEGGCTLYEERAPLCLMGCMPLVPMAPEPPEPPRMTPCADGWSVRSTSFGTAYCQPPDLVCTSPSAVRFLGDERCIEASCDQWPPAAPADAIFVDAAAAAGGNGSRALPFDKLARALLAAGQDQTIVLARGDHALAPFTELAHVRLLGACRTATVLTSPLTAVAISAGQVSLTSLTIRGSGEGLRVRSGARAELADAAIEANTAVFVEPAAELDGSRVLLRGGNVGAMVEGRVRLDQAILSAMGGQGSASAQVAGFGRLHLNRSLVRTAGPDGILVERDGGLSADQLVVESAGNGVTVMYSASATITGAWVETGGFGVSADSHTEPVQGWLRLERATLTTGGIGLYTLRKEAQVEDLIVLSAGEYGIQAFGGDGGALHDTERGRTRLERIELHHSMTGIHARYPALELRDFAIEDAVLVGLEFTDLARGLIERGHIVLQPNNQVALRMSPYFNFNIQISDLFVEGATQLSTVHLNGAGVIGERWHLSVDAPSALQITASGTVLRDLQIDHPQGAGARNTGIVVLYGEAAGQPALDLSQFTIQGPGMEAIRIEQGAQLQLADGQISGYRVGVHLQQAASSRLELEEGVLYQGNEQDVLVDP